MDVCSKRKLPRRVTRSDITAIAMTVAIRIIGLFVQQANHYLRTPVRVDKIELSLFDQFPRVAITMHGVVVHTWTCTCQRFID